MLAHRHLDPRLRPAATRRGEGPLLLTTGVLVFLWSEGFSLRAFEFSEGFAALRVTGVFAVLALACYGLLTTSWRRATANRYVWIAAGIFPVVLIPTFLTGVLRYGQSPIELLRLPLFYHGVWVLLFLLLCRTGPTFPEKLNTLLVYTATANVLLLVALSFFPDLIRNVLSERGWVASRLDRPRLVPAVGYLAHYAFLYCVVCVCSRETTNAQRLRLGAFACLHLYFLLFVEMGRRGIAVLTVVLAAYFVFRVAPARKLQIGMACLAIALAAELGMDPGPSDMLLHLYQSAREEATRADGNVGIRLAGMSFYAREFSKTGWIGIGLVSSTRAENEVVAAAAQDRLNPNDLGIIGAFFRFGFPAIVLTALLAVWLRADLKHVVRRGRPSHRAIATALLLFLWYSLISLTDLLFVSNHAMWLGLLLYLAWQLRAASSPQPANDPRRTIRPLRAAPRFRPVRGVRPLQAPAVERSSPGSPCDPRS